MLCGLLWTINHAAVAEPYEIPVVAVGGVSGEGAFGELIHILNIMSSARDFDESIWEGSACVLRRAVVTISNMKTPLLGYEQQYGWGRWVGGHILGLNIDVPVCIVFHYQNTLEFLLYDSSFVRNNPCNRHMVIYLCATFTALSVSMVHKTTVSEKLAHPLHSFSEVRNQSQHADDNLKKQIPFKLTHMQDFSTRDKDQECLL